MLVCRGNHPSVNQLSLMTQTHDTVAITGNTYPVKDQIKALGGRWDADRKCWMVSADKANAARSLVAGAPAPARSFGARSFGRRSARCGCSCHRSGRACRSCNFDGCEQADGPEDC